MSEHLLLGVDGGGTKTVAWIACIDDPGQVLGRGSSGPSNPQVVGAETCLVRLDEAIDAAFADAGLNRRSFAAACIGLAGADREADRKNIEQWAAQCGLAERLCVVNDALPVLYAASAAGCGVALISGTGSFAFGCRDPGTFVVTGFSRSTGKANLGGTRPAEAGHYERQGRDDGTTARAGGWGYLFGDEGSAYAIAVDGLRAAARSADGRGPATCLLDLLLAELGRSRAEDLISAVYDPATTRTQIAALSRVVFQARDAGDSVAGEIIHEATNSLAEMVQAVVAKLRFSTRSFPLALTGGVVLHHHELQTDLEIELHNRGLRADPVVAVPDPVAGALVIAHQAACLDDAGVLPQELRVES